SYSATRATAYSIAPALWALGVDRIDAVLLSHPHFDHFKEILQIAERFPIGRVYVPRSFMRDNRTGDNRVVEDLFAAGIPVSYIAPGDALQGLGDVEMEVLWPSADVDEEWTLNDGSLVVRFAFGGHSVLLTGDIEAAGIDALLRRGMPRCDVVLWPHHGAESDSVHELFRQTGCNTVVISAPRIFIRKEQRTGQSAEWRLFHTGFDGSVTVDFRRRGVEVRTFRGQRANP
ncbi:MAG: MBL fold metallo-hydrolase, partial [Planctomycetia bacterium]|nr:MBL fold metallo-hydrolase [Planctomycetia bacterium]